MNVACNNQVTSSGCSRVIRLLKISCASLIELKAVKMVPEPTTLRLRSVLTGVLPYLPFPPPVSPHTEDMWGGPSDYSLLSSLPLLSISYLTQNTSSGSETSWTNSIEQSSSWEDNSHAASQKFLGLYGNLMFNRARHRTLSWARWIHNFATSLSKIHCNIILPSTPRFSEWIFHSGFPDQNFVYIYHFPHVCYMPCPPHPHWRDHPNIILWSLQVMKLLFMQSSPASRLLNTWFIVYYFCNSVSVVTRYGLHDWDSIPDRVWEGICFSLHHRAHTDPTAHPASCPMDIGGPFYGIKWQGSEFTSI
jgi:hypothetical protein